MTAKSFTLVGADGLPYQSPTKGTLGGYKPTGKGKDKIYGQLNCKSAARYIARGHYVQYRVFFADEATAIAAGYRPCGKCMPDKYKRWKENLRRP